MKKQRQWWKKSRGEDGCNNTQTSTARDSSYQLSREDQVIIVHLRTGHSRPRHHMFTKFCRGESSAYLCGTLPMTVEHFLQDCQNHQNLRAETWRGDTLVREKIYGLWRTFNVWRHMSELLEFLSDERWRRSLLEAKEKWDGRKISGVWLWASVGLYLEGRPWLFKGVVSEFRNRTSAYNACLYLIPPSFIMNCWV